MPESYFDFVYDNFKKNQGWLVGIISFALAVLLSIINPNIVVSVSMITSLLIVTLFIAWVFMDTGRDVFKGYRKLKTKSDLPNLIRVTAQGIILAHPSPIFSDNTIVAFYHIHEDFEQLIGFGAIINIQMDGIIQIEHLDNLNFDNELFNGIRTNEREILTNTIIKPNFPRGLFDRLLE
ncbi:MAG: hypothetical protein ACLQG5_12975 [Methanobacterium sp.]